jgi:hypothetical protein
LRVNLKGGEISCCGSHIVSRLLREREVELFTVYLKKTPSHITKITMSESGGGPMMGDALIRSMLDHTQVPAQRNVDDFWRRFTARAPGKGR